MGSVRVAIVGVGNCASSLVQGVEYYKDADPADFVPGLMHVQFGDYHVRDVEFVAAFDVDGKKVGLDLSSAWPTPLSTFRLNCESARIELPRRTSSPPLVGLSDIFRRRTPEEMSSRMRSSPCRLACRRDWLFRVMIELVTRIGTGADRVPVDLRRERPSLTEYRKPPVDL